MRAIVYISVDQKGDRQLDCSLCLSVDEWWLAKQGKRVEVVLTPALPLYIAHFLRRKMQERFILMQMDHWVIDDVVTDLKHNIKALINHLDPQIKPLLEKALQKGSFLGEAFPWEEQWLVHDATNIVTYIEGRLWFLEQVERRLQMLNHRLLGVEEGNIHLRNYLPIMIQYLYLQEQVELTPGIILIDSKQGTTTKCMRCGSSREYIYTQYCSFCEQIDVACDVCYLMGTSKGCSLIISRSRQNQNYIYESGANYSLLTGTDNQLLKRNLLHWNGEL